MIKDSFGEWSSVIPESNLDKTIDYVVTGKTIKDITQDDSIINHIQQHDLSLQILDFGCGVGRNSIFIAEKFPHWHVSCYDNPKMLNQMQNFCKQKYNKSISDIKNLNIYDNWDIVKTKYFDYIYATLVFQHIREDILSMYLNDIKNMTKTLLVFGRRYNDDNNKNTWLILEKAGLYPINVPYERDGDPDEHSWCIYQMS